MSLVKKIRLTTVDQFDKDEPFLQAMSEKGLHFDSYRFPFYKFKRGEPTNYQYQTDFQALEEEDKPSYLKLFQDDGWELVLEYPGVYGSWYYFRKQVEGEDVPKIFTDTQSKLELYRKIRRNWLIFFLTLSPMFLFCFVIPLLTDTKFLFGFVGILWTVVAALYAKITINLNRKIKRMQS